MFGSRRVAISQKISQRWRSRRVPQAALCPLPQACWKLAALKGAPLTIPYHSLPFLKIPQDSSRFLKAALKGAPLTSHAWYRPSTDLVPTLYRPTLTSRPRPQWTARTDGLSARSRRSRRSQSEISVGDRSRRSRSEISAVGDFSRRSRPRWRPPSLAPPRCRPPCRRPTRAGRRTCPPKDP